MKTTKLLRAGIVALALFFSGCDAVLEGFYPEFKEGGKFGSGTLSVTLGVDVNSFMVNQPDQELVIALVPYYYNAVEGRDVPDYGNSMRNYFSLGNISSGTVKADFKLVAGVDYTLIAFQKDPAMGENPGMDGPSAVIPVAGKDKFSSQDLDGSSPTGFLSYSSAMPQDLYFSIFGSGSGGDNSWWINGPQTIDNNTENWYGFSIQRPWNYSLPMVTQVHWVLMGGTTVIHDMFLEPYSNGEVIDLFGGNPDFLNATWDGPLAVGSYTLTVSVTTENGATVDLYPFYFSVVDTSGGTNGELVDGSTYDLQAVITGLSPGDYVYLYYYDASGNYVNYWYVDNTVMNPVELGMWNYQAAYYWGQNARLEAYYYTSNGGYQYSQVAYINIPDGNYEFQANFSFSSVNPTDELANNTTYAIGWEIAPDWNNEVLNNATGWYQVVLFDPIAGVENFVTWVYYNGSTPQVGSVGGYVYHPFPNNDEIRLLREQYDSSSGTYSYPVVATQLVSLTYSDPGPQETIVYQ